MLLNMMHVIFNIIFVICCHGFELRMDREDYFLKDRTYCGRLQCQVDTSSDLNMLKLVRVNVLDSEKKQLLATLLPTDSEIQSLTGEQMLAIGSMSFSHGELNLYFTEVSDCWQTAYTCQVYFVNGNNNEEFIEKMILPHSSYPRRNTEFLTLVEASNKSIKSATVSGKIPGQNFENEFSELEARVISKLSSVVEQIFQNIIAINCVPRKQNQKVNQMTQKLSEYEKVGNFENPMAGIVDSLDSTDTSSFDAQMDSDVDSRGEGTGLLRAKEQTKLYNDLDMRDGARHSVLGFVHSLIGSKLSTLEAHIADMVTGIHHMNGAMTGLNKSVEKVYERLNRAEIQEKIERAANWKDHKQNIAELLKLDDGVRGLAKEVAFMNTTMARVQQSLVGISEKSHAAALGDRYMSSMAESLKELRTGQRSMESLLVNVTTMKTKDSITHECITSVVSHSQEKQLKCERGMTTVLGPRVITSLDDQKWVLCDTETDGGGWIVIQRRVRGDVSFARNWTDYKHGFGSFHGDFWLGNEIISHLTAKGNYSLRIDLRVGIVAYNVSYDNFKVMDEADKYSLRLSGFRGNIKDSFGVHNNMAFSTPDRDNDKDSGSCALTFQSGWWYNACYHSHLNGVWGTGEPKGIKWVINNNDLLALSYVEMKIRPVNDWQL